MARILVGGSPLEIRSTLALVLELGGHSCEVAASFEEAACLLREGTFDLVLEGYQEDISSAASAKYLEMVPLRTPVIFVSRTAERYRMISNGTFVGPPVPQDLLTFVQFVLREGGWPQRATAASTVSNKPRTNLSAGSRVAARRRNSVPQRLTARENPKFWLLGLG